MSADTTAVVTTPTGRGAVLPVVGVRALAVVGALLFDARLLPGGFLGVDTFFVTSGFLVTGMLISLAGPRGRVSLSRAWSQLLVRPAPALLLIIGIVLLWAHGAASPGLAQTTSRQSAWSLVWLTNWSTLYGDVGRYAVSPASTPLVHLWAPSIDEQFCLAWSLIAAAVLLLTRSVRVLGAVAAVGAVASGVWQWYVATHVGLLRAYLGTDTRAVALFLGCLLATVVHVPAGSRRRVPTGSGPWTVVFVGAVGFLAWCWSWFSPDEVSLYRGWLVLADIAVTLVVWAVVARPTAWFARLVTVEPVLWIGERSAGLYLWHWPVWVMLSPAATGVSGALLWTLRVAVTLAAVVVSRAVLHGLTRGSGLPPRRLLPAIATPAALLLVLALFVPPAVPDSVTDGAELTAASTTGGLRVLLVGDSWAQNAGYSMALADPEHKNSYVDLGGSSCGLVPPADDSCAGQLEGLKQAVAHIVPDVSVLFVGNDDLFDGAWVDGRRYSPCDPVFNRAYAAALDAAIIALQGPSGTPVDVMTMRDAPGDRAGATCINALIVTAAHRNGARLLDLHGLLCPEKGCVTTYRGEPVYDDGGHLAPAGQEWTGRWLLQDLQSQVTPRAAAAAESTSCSSTPQTQLRVSSYTSAPDPAYPDQTGRELTDGVLGGAQIGDPAWQGWRRTTSDIVLDLGSEAPVCSVEMHLLQVTGAAVRIPSGTDVYVSPVPGQLGTWLGTIQGPALTTADQSVFAAVAGAATVTGRWVTLRVHTINTWTFVDEVTVRGGSPSAA